MNIIGLIFCYVVILPSTLYLVIDRILFAFSFLPTVFSWNFLIGLIDVLIIITLLTILAALAIKAIAMAHANKDTLTSVKKIWAPLAVVAVTLISQFAVMWVAVILINLFTKHGLSLLLMLFVTGAGLSIPFITVWALHGTAMAVILVAPHSATSAPRD